VTRQTDGRSPSSLCAPAHHVSHAGGCLLLSAPCRKVLSNVGRLGLCSFIGIERAEPQQLPLLERTGKYGKMLAIADGRTIMRAVNLKGGYMNNYAFTKVEQVTSAKSALPSGSVSISKTRPHRHEAASSSTSTG